MRDKEYIERGALIEFVKQNTPNIDGDTTMQCVERAMKAAPAADVVSNGVYEQVQWERDMAMQQLEEHGIPFGGKADVVEVKYGAWVKRGNEMKCSCCGFVYFSNNDEFDYCPHCGADMIGEQMDATDNNVGDK